MAFIFDTDLEAVVVHAERDAQVLLVITLVAMLDGVNQGFFEGLMDVDNFAFVVAAVTEAGGDVFTNPCCFANSAGNHQTFR